MDAMDAMDAMDVMDAMDAAPRRPVVFVTWRITQMCSCHVLEDVGSEGMWKFGCRAPWPHGPMFAAEIPVSFQRLD